MSMLTTTLLPDTLYNVRVPQVATYSDEEIAIFGIPMIETSSGKKRFADDTLTSVMLPLTDIINIYCNGYPIFLTNRDQITEIYHVLDDYVKKVGSPDFMLNAPVSIEERALDIDRFASEVFNINKHVIVNATVGRQTGFDLGLTKLSLATTKPTTSRSSSRRVHSVKESYGKENPVIGRRLETTYLDKGNSEIDPDKIERKPRVSRRKKYTRNGAL